MTVDTASLLALVAGASATAGSAARWATLRTANARGRSEGRSAEGAAADAFARAAVTMVQPLTDRVSALTDEIGQLADRIRECEEDRALLHTKIEHLETRAAGIMSAAGFMRRHDDPVA